jgi:hypothetical protein
MGALKRIGGAIGFIIFLVPCILVAIYAQKLNTATTLVGWTVGIGVAVVEGAIIMFLANAKTQKNMFLAIGAILIGAMPAYYWIARPIQALKPFNAHIAEYLTTASSNTPDQGSGFSGQAIHGKLLPVNMKDKTVDPVFFDLSPELKPSKPEEVGAIAALFWEEERIGTYGGKGGAYQEHCMVKVLDKATGTLLAEESFTGSMPPSSSKNGVSQTGDKPYKEIQTYLNGLPHN